MKIEIKEPKELVDESVYTAGDVWTNARGEVWVKCNAAACTGERCEWQQIGSTVCDSSYKPTFSKRKLPKGTVITITV